ncbi:hypothetical protein BP6252_12647 [Coleophoma cylindrospora]|uniref:Cell wall protein n=1 Tax=Coleophoma cylindrospora TaxID=1849047 RepID=A0A3D8QD27_9HELO|nr:hypothetical protein BP6252_12647 [Coleophoma cylindrospora]
MLALRYLLCSLALVQVYAQSAETTSDVSQAQSSSPTVTITSAASLSSSSSFAQTSASNGTKTTTRTASTTSSNSTVPDVYLNVPNLSVGRIELDVDDLTANINLAANVAGLVSINAGVAISVQKINLTITDVAAELELIVRLGNLVDIVNRVFESLDLNPLIITALNDVTSVLDTVVGAVDGLLGSITQGGTTLSFVVDNLGNIVQEVADTAGTLTNTIVGNYLTNMTATGVTSSLGSGLVAKEYSYAPLNALVEIVFNSASQIVQASVVKKTSTATTAASSTTISSAASMTAGGFSSSSSSVVTTAMR